MMTQSRVLQEDAPNGDEEDFSPDFGPIGGSDDIFASFDQ